MKLLWAVNKESDKMWVKWIHAYHIKDVSLEGLDYLQDALYMWRKLLKCRDSLVDIG